MRTPHRALLTACTGIAAWAGSFATAAAAIFDGPGILGAIEGADGLADLPAGDVRTTAIRILQSVLSFLALAAVVTIIIAGIWMIVGMGSDDSRDRAKKIIFYTLIGLIIVLFARVIVGLVTVYLTSQIA